MEEQRGQYECLEAENPVIGRVASSMRSAGLLMLIYGAGFLVMGIFAIADERAEGWGSVLQGGIFLLLGYLTNKAGSSFALVNATKTGKLSQLWTALAKIEGLYGLQKWLMVLGIVLFLVIFFGTFLLIYAVPRLQHYISK